MDVLTQLLYTISNALLVPVISLLLAFLMATFLYAGGLACEAFQRRRSAATFRRFVGELKSTPRRRVRAEQVPATYGLPRKAFRNAAGDREKTLDDIELESERLLGRLGLGIRLGPVLGLAGTLIPLGPALVALSGGDIATLSSKLVVAFTTTVLGLLVGGASFAMHSIRRQWYMQDLNDIQFVFSRLEEHDVTNSPLG